MKADVKEADVKEADVKEADVKEEKGMCFRLVPAQFGVIVF